MKRLVTKWKRWFQGSDSPALGRSPAQQRTLDQAGENLTLFFFPSCPFCRKVLREIERMQLTIECRNIRQDVGARDALKAGGGRTTVPCLRITRASKSGGCMNRLISSGSCVPGRHRCCLADTSSYCQGVTTQVAGRLSCSITMYRGPL